MVRYTAAPLQHPLLPLVLPQKPGIIGPIQAKKRPFCQSVVLHADSSLRTHQNGSVQELLLKYSFHHRSAPGLHQIPVLTVLFQIVHILFKVFPRFPVILEIAI